MARSNLLHLQCGRIKTHNIFKILLLWNIFDAVYQVAQAVDGHTQEFMTEEGELKYLSSDMIVLQVEEQINSEKSAVSFTDLEDENLKTYESPIIFEPPFLDFKSRPVGMPHLEKIIVKNSSPDTSIQLLSISGTTQHFHCSFFQEKTLIPGGNTSFDVVFLARHESPIENILFIHTSLGSFKYQVVALGIPNPYRLNPFLNVKMPLNSSYSPLITMHNPYGSTLQLTDMYTSGGDLHLELPLGENEASREMWEIPPYESKSVMRANFIARVERNHTTYIRIKTNSTNQDYLVIPVEVEVSSTPSIYSPLGTLDYGVMRTEDEPKTLTISLLNSANKHIHIANVIVTPVNEAVELKFKPLKVPPDTLWSTPIATVTFDPSKVTNPKQCCGKIVIKSKNSQYKLAIPYQVKLLRGRLHHNVSATQFYVGPQVNMTYTQPIDFTNYFNTTIVIHSVTLAEDAKPHFSLNFTQRVHLSPQEKSTLWIFFHPTSSLTHLTTYIQLNTNISYFRIPLCSYNGHLQLFLPHAQNQSILDLGTLGIKEKRSLIFALINNNPVDVHVKSWSSSMARALVELVGVDKGNFSSMSLWHQNFSTSISKNITLKPNHYAIFRIDMTAPGKEGLFSGLVSFETQFESIKIPLSLRTAKGSLKADEIIFENSFPGKISSHNLYMHSSFSHPLTVTSIKPLPPDPCFHFEPLKNHKPAILQPEARTLVGKVIFDPRLDCKLKCYSGLPTTSSMGHQWLVGLSLAQDVGDIDNDHYQTLLSRWEAIHKSINVTFQLDTSDITGFLLQARGSFVWPKLTNKCQINFPMTQIGNTSVKEFFLENPSNLPIIVQLVPLESYPTSKIPLEFLARRSCKDPLNVLPTEMFTLQDLEMFNVKSDNPVAAYRKSLEEYFGVSTSKNSIAMLLTPGMRVRFQVGFTPKDDLPHTSLIIIRNNLTVLDGIVVQGQGGRGVIRLGNKLPGIDSTLLFDISSKHLKDCSGAKSFKSTNPNYTVRRAFTARNTGELPVYIHGFDINGQNCQGYGFRILNCFPFELKPNGSKRIDIAYTPDFTLSRVHRTLNVHTSLGPKHSFQFTLLVTVPRQLLAVCSSGLPRPTWEVYFYYTLIVVMSALFLLTFLRAYIEKDRILTHNFYPVITSGLNYKIHTNLFNLKAHNDLDKNSHHSSRVKNDHTSNKKRRSKSVNNNAIDSNSLVPDMVLNNPPPKITDYKDTLDLSRNGKKKLHKNKSDTLLGYGNQANGKSKSWLLKSFNKNNSTPSSNSSEPSTTELLEPQEPVDFPAESTKESHNSKLEKSKHNKANKKSKIEVLCQAEEETSSTTTETSNHESDMSEKDRPREKSGSNKSSKSVKSKSQALKKSEAKSKEETVDDKDFVVSVSKSHRKSKSIKSTETSQLSALELPYKPKTLVTKEPTPKPRPTKLKLNIPKNPPKVKNPVTSDTESSDLGKDSPPPIWDLPIKQTPNNQDEALSQIVQQTEAFAENHSTSKSESPSLWPPQPAPSNILPSSSYSAVVSRENYRSSNNHTILPRITGVFPKIDQFEPETLKNPGPVGQRPLSYKSKSNGMKILSQSSNSGSLDYHRDDHDDLPMSLRWMPQTNLPVSDTGSYTNDWNFSYSDSTWSPNPVRRPVENWGDSCLINRHTTEPAFPRSRQPWNIASSPPSHSVRNEATLPVQLPQPQETNNAKKNYELFPHMSHYCFRLNSSSSSFSDSRDQN